MVVNVLVFWIVLNMISLNFGILLESWIVYILRLCRIYVMVFGMILVVVLFWVNKLYVCVGLGGCRYKIMLLF